MQSCWSITLGGLKEGRKREAKEEKENAKERVLRERKTRREEDTKECAGTRLDHSVIAG